MDTEITRLKFFDSLNNYEDINRLIRGGEAESPFLECKGPICVDGLDRSLQAEIAKEISGFSNSGGGIIIFGVSTDNKREMDVLTQVEPIGVIKEFASKFSLKIPLLTEPVIIPKIKILKEKGDDTKGIAIVYIPNATGDPIRNRLDGNFYIRAGDRTERMPYEVIKRMFAGSNSPDLEVKFYSRMIKKRENSEWEIPIILSNLSNFPAKTSKITVSFISYYSCDSITPERFRDLSAINPNNKLFVYDVKDIIFKGIDSLIGKFKIRMKPRKRLLNIKITIFSENMRAKVYKFKIYLKQNGKFRITGEPFKFLY